MGRGEGGRVVWAGGGGTEIRIVSVDNLMYVMVRGV